MLTPTDGMLIKTDAVLKPGVYHLPQGITLAADGITLDGKGALLVGKNRTGQGVKVVGRNHVTIQNLRILDYYHGIFARGCQGLNIVGCQITATDEVPANTVFLDIFTPVDRALGSGILLWEVSESQLSGNDLQHQMNGLLTYNCRRLMVKNNLTNYCSGWGFHLYDTSDSYFEENFADFCCRYEPRGDRSGHLGADSAGFLIVYKSCRNVFRRNFSRMSGDGFFLAGLTHRYEPAGCDDNLFEENDGSYSPNIAFEATFSRGNVYRNNYADGCNYGFWLGFSQEFILEGNRMIGNRQAGIAVENGFGFQARDNIFHHNQHGILLWSKHVPEFARTAPENVTSYNWQIENNTFADNQKAIRIASNQDHGVRPYSSPGRRATSAPPPHDHVIRNNAIRGNRIGIELVGVEGTAMEDNLFQNNHETDLIEKEG